MLKKKPMRNFTTSIILSTLKDIETMFNISSWPGVWEERCMWKIRNLPRLELPFAIVIVLSKDSLDIVWSMTHSAAEARDPC